MLHGDPGRKADPIEKSHSIVATAGWGMIDSSSNLCCRISNGCDDDNHFSVVLEGVVEGVNDRERVMRLSIW